MTKRKRVVVVTGASAGVGRAVVREFAKEGARIGLIARGRERLDAACREVEQAGGQALALPADVANPEEVESAAQSAEDRFGPVDVWVNNAMTTVFAPFHEITAEEFKRVTEVTYLGVVYGTMAALRRMRTRDHGAIVQVGSALAYRSIPLQSAYCGAKHAIAGFTDSIRSELIHQKSGIHLTMVHLPAMNTPQFSWCRTRLPRQPQPVPPIYQPEVAAQAIVWASSHSRREIYVAWPTVKAIYGQMIAPAYADRYLAEHPFADQETEQPIAPGRPDNLFEPVPGNYAAHGEFDDRATASSPLTWFDLHRTMVGAGVALFAAAAVTFRTFKARS